MATRRRTAPSTEEGTMKRQAVLAGAVISLLPLLAFTQANPLKDPLVVRGTASVAYERAVGKRTEFDELSEHGAQSGVAGERGDDSTAGRGARARAGL